MESVIRVEDQFYILATSSLADDQTRVLKHNDAFAVFDRYGDIRALELGEQGLYFEGTRFLSRLLLRLGTERPLLLSSTVREDNALLAVDLTNHDVCEGDEVTVPRGTLYLSRTKFLASPVAYECFRVLNFGLMPVRITFSFDYEADFADIFEVRGTRRERRGRRLPDDVTEDGIVLGYEGLDGVVRRTRLQFESTPVLHPVRLTGSEAAYEVRLEPKGEASLFLTVSCEVGERRARRQSYAAALHAAESSSARLASCAVESSNEWFNDWLKRSTADLNMMLSETPVGPYPYGGVPWFSTPFGRDGLITAFECLWFDPAMARGVLAYLASTQARETVPEQEAEPGKILHETRLGEMAALGEIPFGRYYGSVDATPLFVLLAGAYHERTGDLPFLETIWPNLELALRWMDTHGDVDGDGFLEYRQQRVPKGLVQQGWKDSHDSIFHADGTLAEGPIALCEVQGYAYAARRRASSLATALGHEDLAKRLDAQADAMRDAFARAFWCEDLGTYALALDGQKRACRVRTSNAGQCLFSGIATEEHAHRVARSLLTESSYSGWGVRTVDSAEARYNPMSYHNGSVWPHDNAMIGYGFACYGMKEQALAVLTGLFDASFFFDQHRLPELFCGFSRRMGEGPTLYPVACSPQSWAAGAVFLLLQACLGLSIKATSGQVFLYQPVLPAALKELTIRNLVVGDSVVDLAFHRHGQSVGVNLLRRDGQVQIVAVK